MEDIRIVWGRERKEVCFGDAFCCNYRLARSKMPAEIRVDNYLQREEEYDEEEEKEQRKFFMHSYLIISLRKLFLN